MGLRSKLELGHYGEPQYGRFCGSRRRYEAHAKQTEGGRPRPVDELDRICKRHDAEDGREDPLADWKFAGRLLTLNPLDGGNFKRPVYGRLYNYGAAAALSVRGLLTTPARLLKEVFE